MKKLYNDLKLGRLAANLPTSTEAVAQPRRPTQAETPVAECATPSESVTQRPAQVAARAGAPQLGTKRTAPQPPNQVETTKRPQFGAPRMFQFNRSQKVKASSQLLLSQQRGGSTAMPPASVQQQVVRDPTVRKITFTSSQRNLSSAPKGGGLPRRQPLLDINMNLMDTMQNSTQQMMTQGASQFGTAYTNNTIDTPSFRGSGGVGGAADQLANSNVARNSTRQMATHGGASQFGMTYTNNTADIQAPKTSNQMVSVLCFSILASNLSYLCLLFFSTE